ncbi:MAG: hypothetical protein ACQESR_29630 [Planctomycetota bacterium]
MPSKAENERRLPLAWLIFQAVGFFRGESGPTQAVLPLVGLAAEKVIRDRYISPVAWLARCMDWHGSTWPRRTVDHHASLGGGTAAPDEVDADKPAAFP